MPRPFSPIFSGRAFPGQALVCELYARGDPLLRDRLRHVREASGRDVPARAMNWCGWPPPPGLHAEPLRLHLGRHAELASRKDTLRGMRNTYEPPFSATSRRVSEPSISPIIHEGFG